MRLKWSLLSATLNSSKGRSLPLATGYELERASRDLLSGGGDSNDGGNSPSFSRKPIKKISLRDRTVANELGAPLWQASRAWRMTLTFPVQSLRVVEIVSSFFKLYTALNNSQGVIQSSISHLNELLDNRLSLELHGVDEVRGTHLASPSLLAIVSVDSDDLGSLASDGSLDDGESDGAESEDGGSLASLDVSGLRAVVVGKRSAPYTCFEGPNTVTHAAP